MLYHRRLSVQPNPPNSELPTWCLEHGAAAGAFAFLQFKSHLWIAKLLGVSISWLAKSRLNGTGPRFIKIGRAVRYAMSAVREYILSRQRNSTSER